MAGYASKAAWARAKAEEYRLKASRLSFDVARTPGARRNKKEDLAYLRGQERRFRSMSEVFAARGL
jgi:hypothetical protein